MIMKAIITTKISQSSFIYKPNNQKNQQEKKNQNPKKITYCEYQLSFSEYWAPSGAEGEKDQLQREKRQKPTTEREE